MQFRGAGGTNTPSKWTTRVWFLLFGAIFLSFAFAAATSALGWEQGVYAVFVGFALFPVLFIYTFVVAIYSAVTHVTSVPLTPRFPNGKRKIPVQPPAPPVALATSTDAPEAKARQVRAAQGANYQPRKKSVDAMTWWALGIILFGGFLMFAGIWPVGVALWVGGFIFIFWRSLRPNPQMRRYRKKYARLEPPDPVRRAFDDDWRGQSAWAGEPPMAWAHATWERFGVPLLAREMEMQEFAKKTNGQYAPLLTGMPDEEVLANPNLVPAIGSGMWQVRNVVVAPDVNDGVYPVQVADLNTITQAKVNDRPAPVLLSSTYAETWFPSDNQLALYPNRFKALSEWRNVGTPITPLEPHLDKLYDVRATEDLWARLVLNVNVMERLVNLHPVVLLIDRGRITLLRPNAWVEPQELDTFVDTVRRIARSAKSAETR